MSVAVPWAPARKGKGGPAQVVCLGLCSPCRSSSGSNPSRPSFDRRAQQPVRSRGGRLGCGNLIQPGGGGGAGARVLGEGPAPAFLPHSFSRPWGPRGSGGQLCTGSGSAQGPVSAGLPAHQPPCPTPRSTHSWTGSFQTLKVGARPSGCLARGEPPGELETGRDEHGRGKTPDCSPWGSAPQTPHWLLGEPH